MKQVILRIVSWVKFSDRNRLWSKMMMASAIMVFAGFTGTEAQAQDRQVSGQVTDSDGSELPGVNVFIKGTTSGTVTDIEGRYTINVGDGTVLVFSYVGYIQEEIEVGNRSVVNVSLTPDITTLTEVVVVGYGTQKKSDVTGAIVSVDSRTISEVPATDAALALQGRMAGVDLQRTSSKPGADMQIRIRGNRSLGSPDGTNNNPLIVLDGIPYLGSLTSINQGDIQSIDILKDASATAIYGSRGSNGVIIITTKRGKAGESKFSYNGYVGLSQPIGKYEVFNGAEYAAFVQEAGTNPLTTDEQESLDLGREVNWQDLMYENGMITNHEIGFSGGTEKTQYLTSGAYFKETNSMPGQSFERYSLRVNLDHQASERIKIGMNTFTEYSIRNGEGNNPMFSLLTYSPLMKPYTDDGEINENLYRGHIDEPFNINTLLFRNEELWEDNRKRIQNFSSLYGEIEFLPGLRYRLNVGLEAGFNKRGVFTGRRLNAAGTNNANITNDHGWSYTIENLLLFDRTIAQNHRINFTGLFSVQENEWASQRFFTTNIAADQLQYYNFHLAAQTTADDNTGGPDQQYRKWGLLSYMARINYTFADRYVLTLTGRADGSSRLAEGNKWFVYPAAALAWNIHEEQFMSNVNFLSNLRFRAGWGRTSNQAIQPFQARGRLASINYSYGPDGGELGYLVNNLPNENLSWEFTSTTNFGLDFGLFGNRINSTVEYYQSRTTDILQNRALPIMSGVPGTFQENIGETETKGVEVTLNALAIEPKTVGGLGWEIDVNFTTWREEIVALSGGVEQDIQNGWFVGQPVDVIYDYKKIGIWQLGEEDEALEFDGRFPGDIRVADLNDNGVRDEDDRTIIGALNPDWMGGMTNRLTYKGLDLSVVLFARVGGMLVSRLHQANQAFPINNLEGRRNGPKVDYWTANNPTNAYPRPGFQQPSNGSTLGYFDATYMKIRSISLGYAIPAHIIDRIGVNTARVYFTANNPFKAFFSDFVDAGGLDPEPNNRGGTNTEGFGQRLNVSPDSPIMRSFILGINLEF